MKITHVLLTFALSAAAGGLAAAAVNAAQRLPDRTFAIQCPPDKMQPDACLAVTTRFSFDGNWTDVTVCYNGRCRTFGELFPVQRAGKW